MFSIKIVYCQVTMEFSDAADERLSIIIKL